MSDPNPYESPKDATERYESPEDATEPPTNQNNKALRYLIAASIIYYAIVFVCILLQWAWATN